MDKVRAEGTMCGRMRSVEVNWNGRWVSCLPQDILAGETFRMFEPDGTPVVYKGRNEFVALSNAEDPGQDGVYRFLIEKVEVGEDRTHIIQIPGGEDV